MRKKLALFLSLVVLCTCTIAYCDEEGTFFSTVLLKIVDQNAKEWMQNNTSRATLAASAILDYALAVQEDDPVPYSINNLYSGTIYVGRTSFILTVAYNDPTEDDSIFILFDTRDQTQAAYAIFPYTKSLLELSIKQICTDGYYKIDPVDLKEVMDTIQKAISK